MRSRLGLFVFASALGIAMPASPASAAAPSGVYEAWTVAGANPSWTGTLGLPPATTFPDATIVTNSNTPTVPSGASAYLDAATPFGSEFGSSQDLPYLSLRTAAASAPSTTTITFAAPTPPTGWGFALGDVDADKVAVTAEGVSGVALPESGLGFRAPFNYCAGSPRPSACGPTPSTDEPTWDAPTATLVGGGTDTSGASGWFAPTTPITSLTFVFTRQIGIPVYQIWFAANTASIGGTVVEPTSTGSDTAPVADVIVTLQTTGGDAVLDHAGDPVSAVTDADGDFQITGVVAGRYDVVVGAPPGFTAPLPQPVDLGSGDVTGITVAFVPIAPVTGTSGGATITTIASSSTTPTANSTTTSLASTPPTTSGSTPTTLVAPNAELPRTGSGSGPTAAFAVALVGVGAATLGLSSVRRRRIRRPVA